MAFTSPEDVVNASLDSIGWPRHVADLYEGSPAARVALQIYGFTRDSLLQSGEWPFAFREVLLVAAGGATPPTPWAHEYSYPSDCLRVRYVRPGALTGGTRSNDPQPVLFKTYNDQVLSPPALTILCDISPATLLYVGKVTDPATWTPNFTNALVSALAKKFSFGLYKSAEIIKARIGLSQQNTDEAMAVDDTAPPQEEMTMNQGNGNR